MEARPLGLLLCILAPFAALGEAELSPDPYEAMIKLAIEPAKAYATVIIDRGSKPAGVDG